MATGKGHTSDAVLVAEETYGTLDTSTPTATKFPLLSETLSRTFAQVENDRVVGQDGSRLAAEQDTEAVSGQTTIAMDFMNIKEILAQSIGASSGNGKVSTPYAYEPDEEIETSYSLILDKNVERWQYLGGMIDGLTIKSSAGAGKVTADIDWIFQSRTRAATAINDVDLIASEFMKHSQLVFRIGTQDNALAATDALQLSDVTISLKNNLRIDYRSTKIMQPIRDSQRNVTISFTAARYNSDDEIDAILDAADAHTKLQADLIWTGTSPHAFKIELPEIIIDNPPNAAINNPGALTFTGGGTCYKNTHDTIMASVSYEILASLTQTAD